MTRTAPTPSRRLRPACAATRNALSSLLRLARAAPQRIASRA